MHFWRCNIYTTKFEIFDPIENLKFIKGIKKNLSTLINQFSINTEKNIKNKEKYTEETEMPNITINNEITRIYCFFSMLSFTIIRETIFLLSEE